MVNLNQEHINGEEGRLADQGHTNGQNGGLADQEPATGEQEHATD